MNRSKSIIITSIIGTFFIAMFVIQPISTQANNKAIPSATPEKNRKVTLPVKGKITGLGIRQRRPNQTQYNPKEVSIDKVKGNQPSNVTSLGRENSIELVGVKQKTPAKGLYSANPGGALSERRKQRRRGNKH